MRHTTWIIVGSGILLLAGCDTEDPERLNRVGKKLVEKSRKLADEADLPTITITRAEKKPASTPTQPQAPEAKIPQK